MHQKWSIPRQECSTLLYHCSEQALIVGIMLVTDIKAQQTQFSSEFAEMPVGYKGLYIAFLQPKLGNRLRRDRVNFQPCVGLQLK
jgi:hypothetical protein